MDIFSNLNTILGVITGLITIVGTIIAISRYRKSKDTLTSQIQEATSFVSAKSRSSSILSHDRNEFALDKYKLERMEDNANEVASFVCLLVGLLLFILNVGWITSVIDAFFVHLQFFGTILLIAVGVGVAVLLPIFLHPSIKFYFLSRAIQDYKRKMQLLDHNT